MGNLENLVPSLSRTPEERRAIATKAGIASGVARREKKTFKQAMETLLAAKIKGKDESGAEIELTRMEMICAAQIAKAIKLGDTNAAKFCVETLQDKLPADTADELNKVVRERVVIEINDSEVKEKK